MYLSSCDQAEHEATLRVDRNSLNHLKRVHTVRVHAVAQIRTPGFLVLHGHGHELVNELALQPSLELEVSVGGIPANDRRRGERQDKGIIFRCLGRHHPVEPDGKARVPAQGVFSAVGEHLVRIKQLADRGFLLALRRVPRHDRSQRRLVEVDPVPGVHDYRQGQELVVLLRRRALVDHIEELPARRKAVNGRPATCRQYVDCSRAADGVVDGEEQLSRALPCLSELTQSVAGPQFDLQQPVVHHVENEDLVSVGPETLGTIKLQRRRPRPWFIGSPQ